MVSKEFIEKFKNDEELQDLRRQVYAITGELSDIAFHINGPYTLEEWKEHLREFVKEYQKALEEREEALQNEPMKAFELTEEEIEQLKREGRI